MRAAGLLPGGRYLVAAVAAEAGRVTGPNADRWACDLTEELVLSAAEGALVAPLGDEIVVLAPVPDESQGGESEDDTTPAAHRFAAAIAAVQPVVEADRSRVRLTIGVSGPAESVTALPGALHEAGSARRLAALRSTSAVSVVTSDEVASHELLLASVPASVLRSFRERLLGPLLAYDDQHRAELLPTLREFLACSGSWNACAARMYVHVNTVRYRIRRIEELTGRDLSRLDDQVDFFLALRIR
jgi:sugar diacid utilization regulator